MSRKPYVLTNAVKWHYLALYTYAFCAFLEMTMAMTSAAKFCFS